MIAAFERMTGLGLRQQAPAWMVGLGHGATHWIAATFYLLLPYLTIEMGLSYTTAGLLVTTFHVCSLAANFGSGMVVDVLGRRVLVQAVALVIGGLALTLMSTADGIVTLLVLVGIIGATNNLWHPAAISFLSGAYPNNRGYALSIHTLGATLGDSVAPLCIGALLAALTWRETAAWGSIPVYIVAVLVFVSLVRLERRARVEAGTQRMTVAAYFSGIRLMIKDKAAMGLCLMAGFRSMTQSGLMTGVGVMAMQMGAFVAGPAAGAWSDRIGRRPVVLAGATGTTLTVLFLALAGNEYIFIAGVSVLGFVLFAIRPVIQSWMMDLTPDNMHGSATSALFGVQSALSLPIPIIGGLIADSYGVGAVFYLLAATMLIANVLVAMLPGAAKEDTAKQDDA